MLYHEIKPAKKLNHLVKCFWVFQTPDADLNTTILPDGYFDLIINIENNCAKKITLTGVWRNHKNIIVKKGADLFGIRFKLLAAEYLLKQSLSHYLNAFTALPLNFWNIRLINFQDHELAAKDLNKLMLSELDRSNPIERKKLDLFDHIYNTPVKNISSLSLNIGWPCRQINRYFNRMFGLPLKSLIDITRCRASYPEIAHGNLSPTPDYYDQAHFIKDIKKHTGSSPKTLSKNENVRFLQLSTLAKTYL